MYQILSIADFHRSLNQGLAALGVVAVRGEITELKQTKNGGVFLTLRDLQEQAVLQANNYGPMIAGLNLVEEGMQVIAYGQMQTYAPQGRLSFKITELEPTGVGARKKAIEELQAQLTAEGLLAAERKQVAPRFFSRIALLTADESAAYSDFIKILSEYPGAPTIVFYPIVVQGERSVKSVEAALAQVAQDRNFDGMVLARGGGAVEDLESFQRESLVRRIAGMSMFTVVGIGHERDQSLAELVADQRVSTPTQAASFIGQHNQQALHSLIEQQRLVRTRLNENIEQILFSLREESASYHGQLKKRFAQYQFLLRQKVGQAHFVSRHYHNHLIRVQDRWQFIERQQPASLLARGFSLARDHKGKLIRFSNQVSVGNLLELAFEQGRVEVQVKRKIEAGRNYAV